MIVGGETDKRWLGGSDRQIRAILLSKLVSQKLGTFIASENAADLGALRNLIEAGKLTPGLGPQPRVTSASKAFAICTASVPTPSEAPMISTVAPVMVMLSIVLADGRKAARVGATRSRHRGDVRHAPRAHSRHRLVGATTGSIKTACRSSGIGIGFSALTLAPPVLPTG